MRRNYLPILYAIVAVNCYIAYKDYRERDKMITEITDGIPVEE